MLATLLASLLATIPADTTLVVSGVEITLVHIEPGTFERESGPGSLQRVELSSDFWLGKYEVTWSVWEAVMGWSRGPGQPDHPARRVSWAEIEEFLERATSAVEGWEFRLPTEAEWEYAARAGTRSPWASGPDTLELLDYAWIRQNANGVVQEVGRRRANRWGLHDMHGNVWEWVGDWMAAYPDAPVVIDPSGPSSGTERVRRGGSVVYGAASATSSHRYQQPPDRGNGNLGFRLVAVRKDHDRP